MAERRVPLFYPPTNSPASASISRRTYPICSHVWPKSRAAVCNSASAAFAAESRGIADSAEYASLFSPLVDNLAEEGSGCRSAGLRPSHRLREGHASGVQGLADRSPLHGPIVLGLPGGVRGVWRAPSGAAAWADHGGGIAAARLGLPLGRPQHRDAARCGFRLGGFGHDRRDAATTSRYASRYRSGACARPAGGGRRARHHLVARGL